MNLSTHKLLSLMLPGGSNSQLAGVEMISVASNKITVFAIGTVSSDNHINFYFFFSIAKSRNNKSSTTVF